MLHRPRHTCRLRSVCLILALVLPLLVAMPLVPVLQHIPVARAANENFRVSQAFSAQGTFITSIQVGDMDSDGDLDIVAGVGDYLEYEVFEGGQSTVYFNNGTGIFPIRRGFGPQDDSTSTIVAIGDMNSDGALDIVAGHNTHLGDGEFRGGENAVYFNDGKGNFTRRVVFGIGDGVTTSIALGDMNGDGTLDVVLGGRNTISLNDGNGVFTTRPIDYTSSPSWEMVVGDMDDDSDLDIVSYENDTGLVIRLNSGSANFAVPLQFDAEGLPRSIALGDIDNDHDLDVVTGGNESQSRIFLNNGRAELYGSLPFGPETYVEAIVLADIEADGDLDIVTGSAGDRDEGGDNELYINSGPGNFCTSSTTCAQEGLSESFGNGEVTTSVTVADVDADGDLDLLAGNKGQLSSVYMNEGENTVPVAPSASDPAYIIDFAIHDVDGDGDRDLVSQDTVYFNDGSGIVTSVRSFAPIDNFSGNGLRDHVAVSDMDNDGDLDIVVPSSNAAHEVYINNGVGFYSEVRRFGTSADAAKDIALADVDDDNDIDVIIINGTYYSETCSCNVDVPHRIYFNDGTARFSNSGTFPFFGNEEQVEVGDVNGDGLPDIIFAQAIYINNGQGRFPQSRPLELVSAKAQNLALGDLDGDRDLDIVVNSEEVLVLLNDGNGLSFTSHLLDSGFSSYSDLDLGDLDGDRDLDIVVTKSDNLIVYQNDGTASFSSIDTKIPMSYSEKIIADMNGDQRPDVVTEDVIYVNMGAGILAEQEMFNSTFVPSGAAFGDLDGDGDLDLLNESNTITLNNGNGVFTITRQFSSEPVTGEWLGDLDSDGDLDVIAAKDDGRSYYSSRLVFLNNGDASFTPSGSFGLDEQEMVLLAMGDLDGDGDLDLIVGIESTRRSDDCDCYLWDDVLYFNDSKGRFTHSSIVTMGDSDTWNSLQLGDLDGDGDLDIVLRSWGGLSAIYSNDGDGHFLIKEPLGSNGEKIGSTALGDFDGDSDLDIALSPDEIPNRILFNNGAGHFSKSKLLTPQVTGSSDLIVADLDGDGDLDIINDDYGEYRNDGEGNFNPGRAMPQLWNEFRLGDINNDGALDIFGYDVNRIYQGAFKTNYLSTVFINSPPVSDGASSYRTSVVNTSSTIPITYTLTDLESDQVREVRAYFSLDGGGRWLPAVAASGTITQNLATTDQGRDYTFVWDTFASGVFGQSDNVVFRIEAYPGVRPSRNGVPGPYQRPYAAASTFPFRVRGTQVQVLHNSQPAVGALVYRSRPGQSRAQLVGNTDQPFRTNGQGFLSGRGALVTNDQLVAMLPVTATATYSLYYTSAVPTETGLSAFTIKSSGVQQLTVSATLPLILFNLDVSLEWDASSDEAYLARLRANLQRASDLLYDWTNGQAALGDVTIYHDKQRWNQAHIRIYATNRLRPNANLGGIVTAVVTDPVSLQTTTSVSPPITYEPGQIRMGATWNRYGSAAGVDSGNFNDDWPRTLAHELGHFALFLDDNYLGLEDGLLRTVSGCPGAMTDPYRDDYGEFHPRTNWEQNCRNTLSHQLTGRADWDTITAFYPWLQAPTSTFDQQNAGPRSLPLAVTRIREAPRDTAVPAIEVPEFFFTLAGAPTTTSPNARAFLFRGQRLVDLGIPDRDRVLARGARPGDRICVYDLAGQATPRLGCETVKAGDEQIALRADNDWRPDLRITPTTSTTIDLEVRGVVPAGLTLRARLYPSYVATGDPAFYEVALAADGERYRGQIPQPVSDPGFEGYVHVFVDEAASLTRREVVSEYALGGNPGLRRKSRTTPDRDVGRGNPGLRRKSRTAPVLSADGQVLLFNNQELPVGAFYSLQSTTALPAPPPWATLIGQAYRLTASGNAPTLNDGRTSITISYLSREVPGGEENGIRMYFYDEQRSQWELLDTRLNNAYNEASASVRGPGIYALMSSVVVSLNQGWNNVTLPVSGTRKVTDIVSALGTADAFIYSYSPGSATDPWRLYAGGSGRPGYLSDLLEIDPGRGHWIYVDRPTTLYLRGPRADVTGSTIPSRPATFYGPIQGATDFVPQAGMAVVALIGETECGRGQTQAIDDQIVYVVHVAADADQPGCGASGRMVQFVLQQRRILTSASWQAATPRVLPLRLEGAAPPTFTHYIPFIRT